MRKQGERFWGGGESYAFYYAVCRHLTRSTKREIAQVKWELAAHLQDHAEVLVEYGLSPEEAERRAVAEMGDPAEIGKALNKSFSVFWMVCKWVFIALFCLLLLHCVKSTSVFDNLSQNLLARLPSQVDFAQITSENFSLELGPVQCLDVKLESENMVMRLDQLAVGKIVGYPKGEAYCICLSTTVYSKNPFDSILPTPRIYLDGDYARARRVMSLPCTEIGGRESGMYYVFAVDYGTEQVEIVWERYGPDCRVQLPLDWEGAP
ncbi:MAG: permease prefix domain 1-containing protein [Oscillospiraceae bacterium]